MTLSSHVMCMFVFVGAFVSTNIYDFRNIVSSAAVTGTVGDIVRWHVFPK